MKKLIFIFFLMPVLCFSQPVTDGLVGYWPFNGNANDESGNGNDGTVNEVILTTNRDGDANSAYDFEGVDDYISLSNQLIEEDKWSVVFWAYPKSNSLSNQQWILDKGGAASGIYLKSYYTNDVGFRDSNGIRYDWDGTENTNQVSFSDISDDWYMFTFYSDGTNIHLYVGDIYKGYTTPSSTTLTINFFGTDRGQKIPLGGILDDILIYNRAITEKEIQALYTGEPPSSPPPPPELCNNLYCDGENIGIGTSNTQGYKLAVAGDFIAQKVKVAMQDQWPDYVFDEDYELEDLQQLEQYIKTHRHLPNIPDAEIVEKDGYELSEMDAKLLMKIEELTLYLIEQSKSIQLLKRENELLKNRLNVIEKNNSN